jgi:hypothetical protein
VNVLRETIRECLSQSISGEPWHGFSLDALLVDVTPEHAVSHPIAGAHSMIELVLHLTAWTQEVASRLRGNPPGLPAIGDWPPHAGDAASAWTSSVHGLHAAHADLLEAVGGCSEGRLSDLVGTGRAAALGTGVSFAVMLLGVAQHTAYHAGQVALLKRALIL